MKRFTAGFIGAGNMGGIFAKAISEKYGGSSVAVVCSNVESTKAASIKCGCTPSDTKTVAANSKYLFLGIKPQTASNVIDPIKNDISADAVVVSMLAGVTTDTLCDMCGTKKIIRIMPNTPCSVGKGMIQVCKTSSVSDDELREFCELVSSTGRIDIIDEKLIDPSCSVSGCGPAFAYMFIESLADGAVKCGLPRAKAYEYACQMLIGAASLALETGKNPGELKDEVCSPGGSTIAGVAALENGKFRAAVIDAVCSAYKRTKELGKN